MKNGRRYPPVTPEIDAVWRVARFELLAMPLEVVREPLGLLRDKWRLLDDVLTASAAREGRFVPRFFGRTTTGNPADRSTTVTIIRDSLPRLRSDLLDTDADNLQSVKQFLEHWGLLGLRRGIVPESIRSWYGTDDVAATREWIRRLQRFFLDPKEVWPDLQQAITIAKPHGTFTLSWGEAGPEPHVHGILGLLDALLLAAPLWALEPAPQLCANERCNSGTPRLIPSPAPQQKYCSKICAGQVRTRRFKQKDRALKRLGQGDSVQAVAKRYSLKPAHVRQWQREASIR
jgi:hypothetical protein